MPANTNIGPDTDVGQMWIECNTQRSHLYGAGLGGEGAAGLKEVEYLAN